MKKILFCGGGTGGHIIPNIALIEQLTNIDIYYIGSSESDRQILSSLIDSKKIKYYQISATKLKRKFALSNLLIPFKLLVSICQSIKLLKQIKPNLVFSKGGYVSLPVTIAAHSLKIPCLLHESDMSIGLSNKIAANFATEVLTSFDTDYKIKKATTFVGSPIRQNIYQSSLVLGLTITGFNGKRPILTFVGGSSGSLEINDFVYNNINTLTKSFDVFLITGKNKLIASTAPNFNQVDYTDKLTSILAVSEIVVSRSGSNTLTELISLKKPSILIPLTKSSRGEQVNNAKYFEEKGCVKVLYNSLTIEDILKQIANIKQNKESMIKNMRALKVDGTLKIVDILNSSI